VPLILLFLTLYLHANTTQEPSLEKIKLQLQWKHQFEFAGFYAAKEKGFYKEVGLDVDFIEYNSKNIVSEVLKGNADYGLTYSTLIIDYMKNKPLVFLANFFKQSPLILVTQKDIKSPSDLKGTKIMGLLDSTHKYIFLEMLDKFDISTDDFTNVPREFSVEAFKNKEIDAISVFITNEIYSLDKKGIPYNILDPAIYGIKFYDLNLFTTKSELQNNPQRVRDFRQASIRGWEYALKNKEEIVDVILKKYNTQNKSKEALLFEAKQIESLMLTNIYPIGSIDLEQVKIISDSFAQSLKLQKETRDSLNNFIYLKGLESFKLNEKQKQYLQNKKFLRMCVDPNWMPIEKIEDGSYIGLGADYIKIIQEKLDIPIHLVKTQAWTESLKKIKQKKCDFLAIAEKTPERQKYLDFTTPFVKIPVVLATKVNMSHITTLEEVQNKPLGIVDNYSLEELLKNKYPNINIVKINSISEGLSLIQRDGLFGLIDNEIAINYEMSKNKADINSIKILNLPQAHQLSIATRNDEPLLNEIFEIALLSIDNNTRMTIFHKWKNMEFQYTTDYETVALISFFTIIIIGVFIYWNLQLKDEIKSKEIAQEKLRQSEEKFRVLFDMAPVLLDSFDETGRVNLWNKECEKVFGWRFEELQKVDNTLELFYPDIEERQKVLESFEIANYGIFREFHPRRKDGKVLSTVWANIKLPSGEVFNIGYDKTQQREDEKIILEKTKQLERAKKRLEDLNNNLEKRVQEEIEKNLEHQIMLMHQSKLVQMGEMIENIAHQWRQPLAQINSSVLVLDTQIQNHNILDESIEEKLTQIESLTAYMSKTIDDFKNFFNPNKSKQLFKVKDAVENSYDIIKGRLHVLDIEIVFYIQENLKCNSYMYELQQVILTLLNNAIDALQSQEVSEGKIILNAKELHQDIIIQIQDNALGIDEKIKEKIFEPYFTTKHKTQGTGLGLYMAKMIIESGFGGSLSVVNKRGGACFTIQIPKGEKSEK
jgi:PAS domain S-box-containing protein